MKKHPLLSNLILTMAIQIGVYLIIIFELQIIEPILQALGVRSEGIMAPTEVVRFFVMRVVLIAAAISAGVIRSKVYFWIPSFLLIFVGFAIYYPDILPRVEKTNMVNLPLIAEHLGYGKNLLPDNNSSLVDTLPTLAAGECLVVGDAVPLPAVVKMSMPNPAPSSSNVNVYDEWNKDWINIAFEEFIKRWRKE